MSPHAYTKIVLILYTSLLFSLLLLALYNGIYIQKNVFYIGKTRFVIRDKVMFFRPWENTREITGPWDHLIVSRIHFTNVEKRWYFLDILRELLRFKKGPKQHILILGGGAGGLAHSISKSYSNTQIILVEKYLPMIQAGEKYFLQDMKNAKFICDDAFVFMKKNTKRYDIIIVDVFNGPRLPDKISDPEFHKTLIRASKKNASIFINLGLDDKYPIDAHVRSLLRSFSLQFQIFSRGHNFIGYIGNTPTISDKSNIKRLL